MAVIMGVTKVKDGNILAGVSVELKNDQFQTIYETVSNQNGNFELKVPDGVYPYLIAVRDYADKYLEYWAHNVPAYGELNLDIQIDTLEVHGINAFVVKGGARAVSVYFRPMSLEKFKAKETDIAPDFENDGICATVNGKQAEVFVVNRVQEYIGQGFLTAYLIQISIPDDVQEWGRVDITIRDLEGSIGCATLFR